MTVERRIDGGTAGAQATVVLADLGFMTLAALVFFERFAEVLPMLAAYAGALYVLGRGSAG